MTDDDYEALRQKKLASIKRDMRGSLENAAIRATHKVMAELETEPSEGYLEKAYRLANELRSHLSIAPAQRTWVGLTDEAIWLEYQRFWPFHPAEEPTLAKDIAKFANVIEAKLKEKNT